MVPVEGTGAAAPHSEAAGTYTRLAFGVAAFQKQCMKKRGDAAGEARQPPYVDFRVRRYPYQGAFDGTVPVEMRLAFGPLGRRRRSPCRRRRLPCQGFRPAFPRRRRRRLPPALDRAALCRQGSKPLRRLLPALWPRHEAVERGPRRPARPGHRPPRRQRLSAVGLRLRLALPLAALARSLMVLHRPQPGGRGRPRLLGGDPGARGDGLGR